MSTILRCLTCLWLLPLGLVLALSAPSTPAFAQEPSTRDLTFANGAVSLAGTLFLPPGTGPFPGVVVLHGSGPETRDPYRADADMLVRSGIAALIYDKREAGESGGDLRTASLDDLIADGLAAVHALQQQPEIAADQVGLLGSSQGAWLAPFAAARDESVSFFVQVTGSATPLANQEMWDDGNSLKALGFSDAAIRAEMKALHLLYSARPLIQRGILPLGDLWFIHYDPYLDPSDAWAQVQVPALVLYGGRDPTVPSRTSREVVQQFLDAGGHPASRVAVFPEAAHALGGPSRNANPTYSGLVTSWIQAVAQGQPAPEIPASLDDVSSTHLRWFGMGAQPTPWYASAYAQLGLILLFLLVSLSAIAASLIAGRRLQLDGLGIFPGLALGVTGLVDLMLTVGLLLVVNYLLNADALGASPAIPLSTLWWLLSFLSTALALSMGYTALRAWQARAWSEGLLTLYTIVALVALGFLPFLAYWNLLWTRL